MNKLKNFILALALLLMGFTMASAEVSFHLSLGSDDYYQPVGDYDYMPYAFQTNPGYAPPRVNFQEMMSQYGVWVSVAPFGQVWKPYASNDWRPYTNGHWVSTEQYGQMWEGYEPWAWAGYHYGDWIFARNYGWVWIPGYDWHAGRVTWARSYDSVGWMPSPPNGYDYSRGYLSNVGQNNQFGYNDNDFDTDFGNGNFNQGGPYNDSRYRDSYYNQGYNNILSSLWVFIGNSHYGADNYSNYSLGSDYTRHVFDRRMIRISNRPMNRALVDRIVGRSVPNTRVETRQLQTDKQSFRVVVPVGNDVVQRVRTHSKEVVREMIAPGFAGKEKPFKGQSARNKEVLTGVFRQENAAPKGQAVSSQEVLQHAREASQGREQGRMKRDQVEKEKLDSIEKGAKTAAPGNGKSQEETKVTKHENDGNQKKDAEKGSQKKSKDKKSKDKDKDNEKAKDDGTPSKD